jgi:hypothetical protein
MRHVLATLTLGLLAVAAGCGGNGSSGGSGAPGKLETLSSVDPFERAFDNTSGHPRLVLLLSPT